jgi:hypothetical protein
MRTFCTIITSDYFPYAAVLYQSLIQFNKNEKLIVLVCDDGIVKFEETSYPGIKLIKIDKLYQFGETDLLYKKYALDEMDAFRWSMKPVLLRYLLQSGYQQAVYVDCDIFFFDDYNFLFSGLNEYDVLLTPSWRTNEPGQHREEFIALYTDGLYNAGFIGASHNGIPALEWWTRACLFKVEINHSEGLFVDQKYLDAMSIMFSNVGTVQHKGCNIAFWNQHVCKRIQVNGKVLINGGQPIVFIHFSNKYIQELLDGNDPLIFPYFQKYENTFAKTGFQLSHFIKSLPEYRKPNSLQLMKRKLLVRTRFKQFMHKLIDRI